MTWACDQRLAYMKARIDEGHRVNRDEVATRFNCTKQTIAADWRRFEARFPGVAAYCARQKAYVRADLAGKQDWRLRALAAEAKAEHLLALLKRSREYVSDALDAYEHSDGRDLMKEIELALKEPRDG